MPHKDSFAYARPRLAGLQHRAPPDAPAKDQWCIIMKRIGGM